MQCAAKVRLQTVCKVLQSMHFCVHQRFMVRNPLFGVLGRLMLMFSIDDGLTDSESDGSIFRRSERLRAFAELWCT